MALSGAHVECGVVVRVGNTSLFYGVWSETIAAGATTTKTASGDSRFGDAAGGTLVFRVRAAAELYVAEGANPDASQAVSSTADNNRAHLTAGELRDIPTTTGCKLSCTAA